MKKMFYEYYDLSKSQKKKLLTEAIIVLDANVLLNLYRYSKSTRADWFKALEQIQDRIHIPYNVALEYQKNRLKVIYKEKEKDQETEKEISSIFDKFRNTIQQRRKYSESLQLIEKNIKQLEKTILKNHNEHPDFKSNDIIRKEYDRLFKDSIGEKLEENELTKIQEIAKERFQKKIPPGYMDEDKGIANSDGTGKYGDYTIWYSILKFAKEKECSIIYVTDDKKEDWWYKINKKVIKPRVELTKEFNKETEKVYYQYSPDQFLNFLNEHIKEKINLDSIKETKLKSEIYSSDTRFIRKMIQKLSRVSRLQDIDDHCFFAINEFILHLKSLNNSYISDGERLKLERHFFYLIEMAEKNNENIISYSSNKKNQGQMNLLKNDKNSGSRTFRTKEESIFAKTPFDFKENYTNDRCVICHAKIGPINEYSDVEICENCMENIIELK